ncbi:MAG: nitroreductase [Yoonia sp.]|nr:nitroreductase [Yoonia sp.]
MPAKNQAALDFLLTRRSRPAKTLTGPVPNADELHVILTAAARTPDHGKLEPWRFIILEKAALTRLAQDVAVRGAALDVAPDKIEKAVAQFATADLAVAVISSPKPSDKVPTIEQIYSAGAVCNAMVNAALAAGWGANWLSGWMSHDRTFIAQAFALTPEETVAGFIHIGTETSAPPERPRPDLAAITTWMRT